MSDEIKNPEEKLIDNVVDIVDAKVAKLKKHGHMMSMYEEFEILRIKFIYDDLKERQEAIRFVTLLKYFMENGPSEAMKLNCKYMYDRYVKKFERK